MTDQPEQLEPDEPPPFQFTIRQVIYVTLSVAIGCAYIRDMSLHGLEFRNFVLFFFVVYLYGWLMFLFICDKALENVRGATILLFSSIPFFIVFMLFILGTYLYGR